MDTAELAEATEGKTERVAKIEQRALRLSALLREIDNQLPIELGGQVRTQLDDALMMLSCRIAATRTLLHQTALSTA